MNRQDGVPLAARDVASTFDCRLENNLWNLASYTDKITKAVAVDDVPVKIYTTAPKADMLQVDHAESSGAHLEQGQRQGGGDDVPEQVPVIGSGPFQVVSGRRAARAPRRQQGLLGQRSQVDEASSDVLDPSSMVSDLESGALAGAIDVPMARFASVSTRPGFSGVEGALWRFGQLG